jgi:hypothetical protein
MLETTRYAGATLISSHASAQWRQLSAHARMTSSSTNWSQFSAHRWQIVAQAAHMRACSFDPRSMKSAAV